MNAMADARDPAKRLDVHVEQVTGSGPLVSLHGHRRGAGAAIESEPPQPGADRRSGDAEGTPDRPCLQPMLFTQVPDQRARPGERLVRHRPSPARPVLVRAAMVS